MGKTGRSFRHAGSVAVLVAVLLAGCGDDESSGDDAANVEVSGEIDDESESDDRSAEDDMTDEDGMDDSSGDDADGDVEALEVTIADGEVSPPFSTYEVAHGAEVRIEITSDTADVLHLHGYDLDLELEPGETGVLEFTADIEGRFELETHEAGLQLLQLEVG